MSEDNVKVLPRRYQYWRTVRGKEIWAQPEPSDEFVWEICAHSWGRKKADIGKCMHCPAWETHAEAGIPELLLPGEDDRVKDGCRAFAEEVCRVAMAVLAREKK